MVFKVIYLYLYMVTELVTRNGLTVFLYERYVCEDDKYDLCCILSCKCFMDCIIIKSCMYISLCILINKL